MMRIQKFFCDITAVTFSPLFAYLKNTWNVEQRLKLEIKEKYASDAVKNIEAIRFFYRAVWLGFVLALRVILRIQKGCIVSDRMRALDFFSGFRNMQLTSWVKTFCFHHQRRWHIERKNCKQKKQQKFQATLFTRKMLSFLNSPLNTLRVYVRKLQ